MLVFARLITSANPIGACGNSRRVVIYLLILRVLRVLLIELLLMLSITEDSFQIILELQLRNLGLLFLG